MWNSNKGCVDLCLLQTKMKRSCSIISGWQYLFVCLLKYFRQTFTLRMIMFGYSMMSSVVVCISAGCLVFSSASAVTQIFVFVTNKTEFSFGAHCMLSDFNYFCLVNQQRK